MKRHACILLALPLAATACQDQPTSNSFGSTTPRLERVQPDGDMLADTVNPVRIGELGPSFAACNSRGEVRERASDGPIPVRAAPFEQAQQTSQLPQGSTFFICTRTHDQRWLGVVFDRAGQASRSCGVSAPVPHRGDYEGPCESGWVASAQVRLVASVGGADPAADQASNNSGQPN
jgi:hypothetical protein